MNQSEQQQVKELNQMVKVKIAPSTVEGVGIFAIRDIEKGEKLYLDIAPLGFNLPYEYFNELHPSVSQELLERQPQIINGSHFVYPVTRLQAYCNHSDTPNYDGVNDVTLVTIKKGEEIFEDYRVVENAETIYPFLKI